MQRREPKINLGKGRVFSTDPDEIKDMNGLMNDVGTVTNSFEYLGTDYTLEKSKIKARKCGIKDAQMKKIRRRLHRIRSLLLIGCLGGTFA